MPKAKRGASKAAAESTTINPAAAWPFPKASDQPKPVVQAETSADDAAPAGDALTGDRIQVAMVSLYTDPAQNVVQQIAEQQLVDSVFQPRTSYDQQALQALADTMRVVGVMTPILVRPLSRDQFPLARDGEPVQPYEIVYGHRRTRGARLAGLATVPAIVRELTDAQVRQLQTIENVQREDLKPLEEAAAYAQYLKAHAVTEQQLADEIGLSRSHVRARIKLLDLVDSVKKALAAGEIKIDVAVAIARLHTPKLQEKALSAIKGKYYDMEDGGKKSVRQIKELLAEKFTLKLSEALFDTEDAALLAGAGACTTCPKRTGNAPEYEDLATAKADPGRYYGGSFHGGPNLCTDPDCFEAKKKQHLANKAAALEAKGKTVITGNKARALVSATGEIKEGYVPLKDVKEELAKANKGKDAPAVAPVTIQDPRGGQLFEVVKVEDLKAAGVKVKAKKSATGNSDDSWRRDQERRLQEQRAKKEKAEQDTRVNVAVLGAVRRAAAGVPMSRLSLQLVTATALKGVGYNEQGLIAHLHGHKSHDALRKAVGSMAPERLATLLLDCALVDDVVVDEWNPREPDALMKAAKHYGIDVANIRREVERLPKDTKTGDLLALIGGATLPPDPAGARAQDAQLDTKGSGPKGKGTKNAPLRKPRMSARDAKQGIAAAMQGMDGAGASTPAQRDLVDESGGSRRDGSGAASAAQGDEASAATALANLVAWPPLHQMLVEGGITTREQLADLDVDELVAITGQDHEAAGALILKARETAQAGAAA